MRVETKQVDDVAIIEMEGKLVAGVGDVALRESINSLLGDGHRKIVVDLSAVTHIDSSGVGELVASNRITGRFGAAMKVVRATEGGVERVLNISQILPLFSFYDSATEALTAFSEGADAHA